MEPVFLGAYRLIAKLGRGRVTDVYLAVRAEDAGKQDLVVIKRLRTGRATGDEPAPEDVQIPHDAALALRLHHPNIAATYELHATGTAPYWVMEYVEGQPLDRLVTTASRAGGLPLRFSLSILCDLLAALDYAHSLTDDSGKPLGIVHRDVRPHNIFVSYDGDVKLLDFGIPRPAVGPEPAASSSESGRAYVAPEQALAGNIDQRTDIFAIGLVMWELLAKQRRSSSEIPIGTLHGLQPEAAASDAVSLQTELSAELSRINDRALERDPELRYASAHQMRTELEQVLSQLDAGRWQNAELVRGELGSTLRGLFKSERGDASRRIQLLLAIDGSTGSTGSAPPTPEPQQEAAADRGTNGVSRPALRLSAADAAESSRPSRPTPRVSPAPDAPRAPALPRSTPPPNPAALAGPPHKNDSGAKRAAALAAAMLVIGAIGVTWALKRTAAKHETQVAAARAADSETAARPVLRLCGSNTVGAELAPALVEGLFASRDNSAKVAHKRAIDSDVSQLISQSDDKTLTAEITARGTATGFAGLADGTCDVGMASRPIEDAEIQRLIGLGMGDLSSPANEHVIALDGVAVIVHPNNPLSTLDRGALHDVFTGQVSDWSVLGGSAGPIHVLARDDQSGTYDTFAHLVLQGDALLTGTKRYARNDALSDAVASDPAAIGFVGLAYVRTAKALAVGEAGAAPLLPTQFTVATEGYMLSRRLYLYTPDKPRTPWVTELVNFAMSPQGQEIAKKAGFINLSLLTDSASCGSECPPQYLATVGKARRVSVDLRFRSGSNQPDSRARRDLDRLVKFLQNFPDAKVLLLGFSDSVGNPSANVKLSLDRAQTIADELQMRGVQPAVVKGFGSEMPVASNDTEAGRQRNRRVEVWFKQM